MFLPIYLKLRYELVFCDLLISVQLQNTPQNYDLPSPELFTEQAKKRQELQSILKCLSAQCLQFRP